MKFKTTAILSLVLIVLLGWVLWDKPQMAAPESMPDAATLSDAAQRTLFDPAPKKDDIVKVTVTRRGVDPWRFEKSTDDGGKATWRIVAPFESVVPSYEVDNIVRTIGDLKYQIKHVPGEAGAVTVIEAGLERPKFSITLEDEAGTRYGVQVGRQVSSNETYVRRGDEDVVYVVQHSLEHLVKNEVNEYRDRELVKFKAPDATSIEILYRPAAGDPVQYRLASHNGGDWVFEEPFNADANDKIIKSVVDAASRLRATEWVAYRKADGFGRFGLQFPALEIEITTKKTTPGDSGDEAAGTVEKTETARFKFAISDRGPLGNATSVYASLEDADGVAIIAKSIADRFTPNLEQWRTMDIFTTPVTGATKVQIRADGASATVVKGANNQWTFEKSGARAGRAAVNDLLKTIDGLKALNFVDGADPTDAKFGLTHPRTEVVLTLPGADRPERIAVGNPTDDVAKRVYYLRRGESASIAKIRADDALALHRKPIELLDRQIVNVAASRIQQIDVSRPDTLTRHTESLALVNAGSHWTLGVESAGEAAVFPTDPVTTTKLVTTLSSLTAKGVVSQTGEDAARYRLDDPAVRVTIAYEGPTVVKADDSDAEPASSPSLTIDLRLAESEGRYYARRADQPTIYELNASDYKAFLANFHSKTVVGFQPSQATSVTVTSSAGPIRFDKTDSGWVFAAEPDLPIDAKKVTNLLIQLQDLKLKRYVAYSVDSLASYGLDVPAKTVTVVAEGGETVKLLVSARKCPGDSAGSFYAMVDGTREVFIMTPDSVSRFDITLDDFEKSGDS